MIIRVLCIKGSALAACLLLTGCASVTRGTTDRVVVNASPAGARITNSLGIPCRSNPCTIEAKRNQDFTVTASKPGYRTQSVYVGGKIAGSGAAGLAGNLLAGGLIGVGVDAATGAAYDHWPNPVNIRLKPGSGTAKTLYPLKARKKRRSLAANR